MCLQPYLFALWALTTLKLLQQHQPFQNYIILLTLCRQNNIFFLCSFCTKKIMKEYCKDHLHYSWCCSLCSLGIVLTPQSTINCATSKPKAKTQSPFDGVLTHISHLGFDPEAKKEGETLGRTLGSLYSRALDLCWIGAGHLRNFHPHSWSGRMN